MTSKKSAAQKKIVPATGIIKQEHSSAKNDQVAIALAKFSDVFVDTPHHTKLESGLDGLRRLGLRTVGRPQRALRCLAPPATGKTTAALRYTVRINGQVPRGEDRIPVLYVTLQNASTSKKLMSSMLEALGDLASTSGGEQLLKRRFIRLLKLYQVEVIILDEVHHLAYRRNVSEVINALKALLNDRVCPVAFLGTEDALRIFNSNKELAQRIYSIVDIQPLEHDAKGRKVMARFLSELDLELRRLKIFQEASDFIQDVAVAGLMRAASGIMGCAARILQAALEIAIRRNARRIEIYDVATAIDTWAIPQGYCKSNPFYEAQQ